MYNKVPTPFILRAEDIDKGTNGLSDTFRNYKIKDRTTYIDDTFYSDYSEYFHLFELKKIIQNKKPIP